MKKVFLSAAAASAAALAFAAEITFSVTADRADCIYSPGEEAVFTVTAMDGTNVAKSGSVTVTVDNFGPKVQSTEVRDLSKGNPFTVKGSLAEPGFLRVRTDGEGVRQEHFSVGYAPEKIRKGSPSPADFDEFWARARARFAREVPLDARVAKVPERCTADYDFYRISFATYGQRVHGYMSVPTDASLAPYPLDFQVSPAGFGGWTNDMECRKDAVRIFMGVYPFEPDWKWQEHGLQEKYDAFNKERVEKYGGDYYATTGIAASREEYFYYSIILGLDRVVDWAAALPYVDRSRVSYWGTSQGGGIGFFLTGLNHVFSCAAFYVPALTDTMGCLAGRQSGWPRILEANSATPEARAAAERNAPYFDAANFASRIRCPVRVAVGFADTTCPPCAVYAAYNEIRSADKKISHGIGMGHGCRVEFYCEFAKWISATVKDPVVSRDVWHGYSRTIYDVGGTRCWVVSPKEPRADKAWVWCTEWPDAFADRTGTEELLKRGFHFLHAEVGTMSLGGPKCQRDMDAFYDFFTRGLGLARKGCLTGVSRGGLYAFVFASRHPDRVTCLYGDHAVLDFKSWPLRLEEVRDPAAYRAAMEDIKRVYGFTDGTEVLRYRGNPVETEVLKPVAEAKIPVLLVVGEADEAVTPEYNANVFESRYRKLGGSVKALRSPRCGHHPHGSDNPSDIADFIASHAE